MTDKELMNLEMITYLTDDVFKFAGLPGAPQMTPGITIGQYLSQFTEEVLGKLEQITDKTTQASMNGTQWAATIRAMKADKNITGLRLVDSQKNEEDNYIAFCFADENGKAYVTFKGTEGGREWMDDVDGLNETDTACQREALDFVEGLPAQYTDITVTGHSKGGNKAQYVTLLSDRVTRCISMDGQGFSQDFIDKYWAEIEARGSLISNYSLSTDYVHILLYTVPGAKQVYIRDAMGNMTGKLAHVPVAYFSIVKDENGKSVFERDENGELSALVVEEAEGLTYLRDFLNFFMYTGTDDDKSKVVDYLRNILALSLSSDYPVEKGGTVYTQETLMDYVRSDPDALAVILAYLLKYVELYHPTSEVIYSILSWLGLADTVTGIMNKIADWLNVFGIPAEIADSGLGKLALKAGESALDKLSDFCSWLIKCMKNSWGYKIAASIRDEKISEILGNLGIGSDSFLVKLQNEFMSIKDVDTKKATKSYTASTIGGKTYDYSSRVLAAVSDLLTKACGSTSGSVSAWTQWSDEDWYDDLFIPNAVSGINYYYDHISQLWRKNFLKMRSVFDEVNNLIDKTYADRLDSLNEQIHQETDNILRKAADIIS